MISGRCIAAFVLAFLPFSTWGEAPRFLIRNDALCDTENVMCIQGSLSYRPGSRVLTLFGRVSKAPGPGWVRILFRGTFRDSQPATTIMEFPIRGAYSEIIDKSFIPDHPQIDDWRVFGVIFEQDDDAARAARRRR